MTFKRDKNISREIIFHLFKTNTSVVQQREYSYICQYYFSLFIRRM